MFAQYFLFPLKNISSKKLWNLLLNNIQRKCKLSDCVLKISDKILSPKEIKALKNLIENKDLVIQKAGKGNTIVIPNKNNYI